MTNPSSQKILKWSTKTGHRVRVFSSIDFPIRLGVTHRYIRAVLVRCNIQRYSPLWRELPRWSLRNPPPASIRSSDSWRSVPLGCYPSSFRAGSYSAWSGIATITAGTACSYNDCLDRCGTSPRRAYHGFPMPFPVLSWWACCPARTTWASPLVCTVHNLSFWYEKVAFFNIELTFYGDIFSFKMLTSYYATSGALYCN